MRLARHGAGAKNRGNALDAVDSGRSLQVVTGNVRNIPWVWDCESIGRKCGLHRSLNSACGLLCCHRKRTLGQANRPDCLPGARCSQMDCPRD